MRFTKELFKKKLLSELPAHASTGAIETKPGGATSADISELLRIHGDREFLEAAYNVILGREADISGLLGYMEALREHVPRRIILVRMAESEEGQARQGLDPTIRGWKELPTRSFARRQLDRLIGFARGILRQVLLVRFDSIDYRLSFLMQEMSAQNVALSRKIDESIGAISDELAAGFMGTHSTQTSTEADLEERLAALESRLDLHTERLRQLRLVEGTEIDAQPRSSSGRVARVDGFLIGVPAEEWRLATHLEFCGVPEPGVTKLLKRLIKPGMVVVDVGANIGLTTLLAARILAGGKGKVHSFEPAPAISDLLRNNIQINGFTELDFVHVHEFAVTEVEGTANLRIFPDRSGHNTLFGNDDSAEKVPVETISLDIALQHEPSVDVVKIDAKGAGPFVLRGMNETIHRNPDIIILLEFAPVDLNRAGVSPKAFLKEIGGLGFIVHKVDDVTGELQPALQSELLNCFSVNLHLRRAPMADERLS